MLKCSCEAGETMNASRQPAALLARLQNPVVLTYTPARSLKFWPGHVTNIPYEFGGAIRNQCVDGRDVEHFLSLRENGLPMFVRATEQPDESPEPIARDQATEPGTEGETPEPGAYDAAAEYERLKALSGVGDKTAAALVEHGYTLESLALLTMSDEDQLTETAQTVGVAVPLLSRAAAAAQDQLESADE